MKNLLTRSSMVIVAMAVLFGMSGCSSKSGGVNHSPTVNAAANAAPKAVINATPITATYGTTISFDASGSSDSDGSISSYKWSEGGATLSTEVNFTKDDLCFGTHTITLTVTDNDGATGSATVEIVIQASTQLKKTGQIACYDDRNASATIDCTDPHALKDDGYYRAGVAPIYTRDNDANIVTDHITGLQWQDDANASSVTKPWLTRENYDKCIGHSGTGPSSQTPDTDKCTDTTRGTAAAYCTHLTLGGHNDWRLPTIDELMYITDRSKRDPAIDSTFRNVASDFYWSYTTKVDYNGGAWNVYFPIGGGLSDGGDKHHLNHVRCVRSHCE